MNKKKVLDLFSGIGGFSLGLERTGGFETVAFCEIEEFPRKVLKKHWPDVPIYEDVRDVTAAKLASDGISADVITGGFPCQDISFAGSGEGINGERSGLYVELIRILGELRPKYAIVENVSALLSRGLGTVLGDLAEIGYDAEWHCIQASHVGAPHLRDRVWVIAYPQHTDSDNSRSYREEMHQYRNDEPRDEQINVSRSMGEILSNPNSMREPQQKGREQNKWRRFRDSDWWRTEPAICRVAHGVRDGVHRLKALGNSVVPRIPEMIGYAILENEA